MIDSMIDMINSIAMIDFVKQYNAKRRDFIRMSKKLRSAGVLNSCCSENFMRSLFYKHLRSAASKRRTSKMSQMVKKIL